MFLLAEGGHHTPLIVEFVNHYLGEPVSRFQIAYTKPFGIRYLRISARTPKKFSANTRRKTRFRGIRLCSLSRVY